MLLTAIFVISYSGIYHIEHIESAEGQLTNISSVSELIDKGNSLANLGKYEDSIIWYDKALDMAPKDLGALEGKALALVDLGRHDDAIAHFDKILAIDPNNINTLYNKGKDLDYWGSNEEAISYYDKALALRPNDTKILNSMGLALHHSGSNEEAISYYDKVINLDPNDSEALYNRGVALDNLGRNEEAEIYYKKALVINPDHVDALYNFGSGLYYSGDYDDAVTYLDRVLTLEPDHIDSLNYKGKSLASLGKNDEAIIYFDKVLEIDPDNLSARSQKELSRSVNYEADSSNSGSFVQASTSDDSSLDTSEAASEVKTFSDSKTKLSFEYPSDWEVASDEYAESIYGDLDGIIVLMLPKSFSGSGMSIVYEELPFSMSTQDYVEIVKKELKDERTTLSDTIPVSIGSLDGLKYNLTVSDETLLSGGYVTTQIVLVKEFKAFAISINLGETDTEKDLEDIESMLDSLEIGNAANDNIENGESDTLSKDKDLDAAKEKARNLMTFIFNSLFPETREKFSNSDYGVDMEFPKNWTGFEMKVIFPMALVSPEGFNIKDIFSTITESSLDSVAQTIVSDSTTELSQEKKQELTESGSKKLMEHVQNKTSTMGVFIYGKEFAKLVNSMNPNSKTSADSLTSIYESLAASDSTVSCDRKTLQQISLNNNISAETSTEQCLYTDSNKKQDNLNYFVLTPNAIVGVQYTSDPNNENDKFLTEFEEALKTLSVKESLPINNQTIQQFLSG